MPKSNSQIAAEVRAGGNLPGDMVFDPTKPADEQVRAKTAAEKAVDTDDKFMSDLESVLDRPHTSELVAFDALTPHVRDIRDFAR